MIAKIVAWGEDRAAALAPAAPRPRRHRGARGRDQSRLSGAGRRPSANLPPAQSTPALSSATATALLPPRRPAPDAALAAAALGRLLARAAAATAAAAGSGDPFSPWARIDGWRLGGTARHRLVFRDGAEERTVVGTRRRRTVGCCSSAIGELAAGGERRPDGILAVVLDGVRGSFMVLDHGAETAVFLDGESWRLVETRPARRRAGDDPAAGRLTAPMPGRVIQLLVEAGDTVRRGEPMMIIEAMKMEHTVTAPADGVVEAVRFARRRPRRGGRGADRSRRRPMSRG